MYILCRTEDPVRYQYQEMKLLSFLQYILLLQILLKKEFLKYMNRMKDEAPSLL